MNSVQLNLFAEIDLPKAANDNDDWEARFEAFHRDNPKVYELVKQYALQAVEAGYDHYGIQTIFERIRWHTTIETTGDPFKINNNYGAFYARKFNADHPHLDGFFRTREWKGKSYA